MSVSRKALSWAYGLIAVLAFIGTWGNMVAYRGLCIRAYVAFWRDSFANPASRFLMADILFFSLAVFTWMVLEARRLHMRWVWLYLILGTLIALSVTIPVFLIFREYALARREPSSKAGTLCLADLIGLVMVGLATVGLAAWGLHIAVNPPYPYR